MNFVKKTHQTPVWSSYENHLRIIFHPTHLSLTYLLSSPHWRRAAHLSFCHTGRIRTHGIGGGHKQKYRMIDFQRLCYETGKEARPFEEKVVEVRYDPCRWDQLSPRRTLSDMHDEGCEHTAVSTHRSADIALVAGGNRKRWIIATENMQVGDIIKTSGVIGRMAGMNLHWRWWVFGQSVFNTNWYTISFVLLCSLSQWGWRVPTGSSSCGHTGEQLGDTAREGIRVYSCCR